VSGADAPLAGRKVVVTRAADQVGDFTDALKEAGAEVIELPTIETVPPDSWEEFDRAALGLAGFDYALFTSANALRFFLARLKELGLDATGLKGVKIIAVGPKTAAALVSAGFPPDVIPAEFVAEGVVEALSGVDMKGKRVLFPRAKEAREVLVEALREMGAEVVLAVVYQTVCPKADPGRIREIFRGGGVSAITFTSSSTVRNFMKMAGEGAAGLLGGVSVACIGPVTAKTCEEMGILVSVVPRDYTVDALFDALTEKFGRRS